MPYFQLHYAKLSNSLSDKFLGMVEDELFTVASQQKYGMDDADQVCPFLMVQFNHAQFKVMVSDNIESRTYSDFQTRFTTLFRFSVRLALDSIQTIRQEYPNFLSLFEEKWVSRQ